MMGSLLANLPAADPAGPEAVATVPIPDAHLFAGTWRYDPARSTELSAWGSLRLIIAVDGPRVTFTRQYAAGRRTYEEVTTIDLSKTTNIVPAEWWPDNRHLGAYMGGEKNKKIRLRLYDPHLLRLSADITLATQQGERNINILTDYKLSVSGEQLTLIELRSTRNQPIVYSFQRVTGKEAAPQSGSAE